MTKKKKDGKRKKNIRKEMSRANTIVLKLSYSDRLLFSPIYLKEMDILTGILQKEIQEKINLSQKEVEAFELKVTTEGGFTWKKNKDKVKSFSFTKTEMLYLKTRVEALDKQKKISQDFLNIAIKIQTVKIENEG